MEVPALNSPTWLTSRRLRIHGLLLGLVIWSIYAWIFATPGLRDRNGLLKGTDFLHYYTLGSLALEHRGVDLYNMQAQSAFAQERVPEAGHLVYVPLYGPQVSVLFAPLAALPYAWALTFWIAATTTFYALCCYAIWRTCPNLGAELWIVFVLAAAYPAFVHLIVWGQNSALALVCFSIAYLGLRSRNFFLAGLAVGCLVFKPQLGLAAGLVFLLTRQWKVVAGATLAAISQLLVGWLYYGTSAMRDYVDHLVHVGKMYPLLEPRPYQVHCLRAFWAMLIPQPHVAFALYVASALAVMAVTLRCWKTPAPLSLRYSALLLATVLVSPHLTVYDLVILVPAFLLLSDWAIAQRWRPQSHTVGLLLYLCYALPLAGPTAQWTHVQLSVPAMSALLGVIQRRTPEEASLSSISSPL